MGGFRGVLLALAIGLGSAVAAAAAQPGRILAHVQTSAEALAVDAGEYARRFGVGIDEASRRLRAQAASVGETDRLRDLYGDRLAGISIDHHREFAIQVLLTGNAPVADTLIRAGGMTVPVRFRTGAAATRAQVVTAINVHREAIRNAVPGTQGMGLDQRTGELVVLANRARRSPEAQAELEALTGVPVRIEAADRTDADTSLGGGARVMGSFSGDPRNYICTTGFVVTDGARTGVVTAAHCPDTLFYDDPERGPVPLRFEGGWGVGFQDVQVNTSGLAHAPLFYADTARTAVRPLTGARARESTRAGEFVCRRGESAGYSCSEVELVDYAPPGALCAGPCDPVWVTAAGPSCKGGDSGGPVFSGTVAFGIVKGANYSSSGRCNFYYYMSTDYLPDGWTLLADDRVKPPRFGSAAR